MCDVSADFREKPAFCDVTWDTDTLKHCHYTAHLYYRFDASNNCHFYAGAAAKACSWYNGTTRVILKRYRLQADSDTIYLSNPISFGDDWNKYEVLSNFDMDVTSKVSGWHDFTAPQLVSATQSGQNSVKGIFTYKLGTVDYWYISTGSDNVIPDVNATLPDGKSRWSSSKVQDPIVSARWWKDYNPNPSTGQGTWHKGNYGYVVQTQEYARENKDFYIHCEIETFSGKRLISTVYVPYGTAKAYFYTALEDVQNMPSSYDLYKRNVFDKPNFGNYNNLDGTWAGRMALNPYSFTSGRIRAYFQSKASVSSDKDVVWSSVRWSPTNVADSLLKYETVPRREGYIFLGWIPAYEYSEELLITSLMRYRTEYVPPIEMVFGDPLSDSSDFAAVKANLNTCLNNVIVADTQLPIKYAGGSVSAADAVKFYNDEYIPRRDDTGQVAARYNGIGVDVLGMISDWDMSNSFTWKNFLSTGNPNTIKDLSSIYFIAVWDYAPNKLFFHYNRPAGTAGTVQNTSVQYREYTYGDNIPSSDLPIPSLTGYDFMGWEIPGLKLDGTQKWNWHEDMIATAIWKPHEHSIKYKKGVTDK